MEIPLIGDAIEILTRRKSETSSIFVFPGTGKRGHIIEPKRAWTALLKRSGLNNLRTHDLRRTCGSYQAATGANLTIIGKSLGHKNTSTTAVYARVNLNPVRSSMEKAAAAIQEAAAAANKIVKVAPND